MSCVLGMPSVAGAVEEPEIPPNDGRVEGYNQNNVKLDKPSVALVWMAFAALSVVALAALFKDPKRSHLD